MLHTALRGIRDGFVHDEHEHGAVYEAAARTSDLAGRVLDRILLSPRGSAMPGEGPR
jgi:hypothetical protein